MEPVTGGLCFFEKRNSLLIWGYCFMPLAAHPPRHTPFNTKITGCLPKSGSWVWRWMVKRRSSVSLRSGYDLYPQEF